MDERFRVSQGSEKPSSELKPRVNLGHRDQEPGVNFRNIQRGKSFLEARSAVQRHIEKMFMDANDKEEIKTSPSGNIKHTMHGVSHVRPDEEDKYCTPPPVHYGVEEALRARKDSPQFSKARIALSDKFGKTSPILSDSDKSKTENFNSRSTLGDRSLNRKEKFFSIDSLDSATTGASTFVDLGNIDISKQERRKSTDAESLAAQVRRRERSKEEDANIRRISVHQDTFDFNQSTQDGERSVPSSPGNLESIVKVPTKFTSSVSIQKTKQHVKHKIEYLGAVPLRSKATNLDSLQVPLKELYLKHKALQSLGHSNLPGTLEISDTGLKVQYIRELHKGVQELFNSFPTIAVWAAVKFTHKTVILPSSERRQKFAFVPLISDPQNEESKRVFYDLEYEEINLAQSAPHPPVFACVMRRAGMPKQLECHGFICSTPEDAIVIAANLYQALVDTMRRHKAAGHPKTDLSSSRNLDRIDFARRSSRRSRNGEPPVRPPRKRRPRGEEPRVVTGLVRKRSVRSSTRSARSNKSNRSNRSARRRAMKTVQIKEEDEPHNRLRSQRLSSNDGLGNTKSSGDILTKVSIGRTKSFVKPGNQYNLQELFRELKEKEGVDSIDDVLKRVIQPNGMSFNDIKPVYRELLLKLAMTMSQDEIFERSKSIMASNKKGKKKAAENENSGSLGSFFKSFSRSNSKSSTLASKASKGNTIPLDRKPPVPAANMYVKPVKSTKPSKGKGLTKADISGPLPMITDIPKPSSLSKDHAREYQSDDAYVSCSECAYETVCTYDTCTCRIKKPSRPTIQDIRNLPPVQNSRKPTEVPRECDADSCISSEKCYCSLRGDPRKANLSNASVYSEITADSGTVTDTSCYSTNCYSTSGRPKLDISTCESPLTAWKRNMMLEKGGSPSGTCCSCSEYSDSPALSNSLKFSRNLPPIPDEGSMRRTNSGGSGYQSNDSYSHPPNWLPSRRVANDGRGSAGSSCSSSASPTNSSIRSSNSPTHPKVLVLSAVDPRGNIVYRGSSSQENLDRTPSKDEDNILSLKKSAEIAALFSGAKINQTTDLVDRSESESCSCSRSSHRSLLSNYPGEHLGYFP